MYNLRPRRGIRQEQIKFDSKQGKTTELKNPNIISLSENEHNNCDDKDLETDGSSQDSPELKNKVGRIYPELPKEDEIESNQETAKLKRQIIEKKYPKLKEDSNSSGKLYYVIVTVFVLLITYFCISHTQNTAACETPVCLFQEKYKVLRDNFLNQENLSWKIIQSAVNSVVNKSEHTQPSVILLVANKNAKIISSCIANILASSVELSYGKSSNYPKLQSKQTDSPEKMIERIYTTFEESFAKKNHHVIVLENLDTIFADSAMALHLFCDHENAPYKNIVIILTATVEDSFMKYKKLRPRDMDTLARDRLDQVWKLDLDDGKRAALLARITTNVALIHNEENVPTICHV